MTQLAYHTGATQAAETDSVIFYDAEHVVIHVDRGLGPPSWPQFHFISRFHLLPVACRIRLLISVRRREVRQFTAHLGRQLGLHRNASAPVAPRKSFEGSDNHLNIKQITKISISDTVKISVFPRRC